jgi:arylsulfatase A-like enzyme
MTATEKTDRRPNVIWIIADQFRGQALSLRGDPNVTTPNLDRLAYEGTYFPNAISGTPLCTPARGAFITGRYPHNAGTLTHDDPLDPALPTVATVLRDDGYDTCYIGKWHLDGEQPGLDLADPANHARNRIIPKDRRGGFETWFGFEYSNRPYDTWVNVDTDEGTVRRKLDGYQTDALTDILLDWVESRDDATDPFFAVLSVEPPHTPYVAPPEDAERHNPAHIQFRPNVPDLPHVRDISSVELAGYYAAIERIDANIGRIREMLAERGLTDDTYIFFFSDHGDLHGSHGQFRKTAPWEEAIRVPMIVGGPSTEHQNWNRSSAESLINHVDLAPTTLGLCGITVPDFMEGYDYSGRILEQAWTPHDAVVPPEEPNEAYISLPIPTKHPDSVDRPYRGIVTRDGWKYVCLEGQPWLLFDLNRDPFELVNLAHNSLHARHRDRLHGLLEEWVARTGDTFALPSLD